MNLSSIAVRNIKRRKGKTALLVIGLMLAIASLVSIVTLMTSFRGAMDKELGKYGFNILIFPKSSNLSLTYGGMDISGVSSFKATYLKPDDMRRMVSIKKDHQVTISPKFISGMTVEGKPALLVGITPKAEMSVKKWWDIKGRGIRRDNDLIFGSSAAAKLGIELGEKVELSGRPFKAVGIIKETGSQDDDSIFGDIGQAQAIVGLNGRVNFVEIATEKTDDIDAIVAKLSKVLPNASVSSVSQAVEYKESALDRLTRFGLTVSAVVVFISGMIVFSTMTSSVMERKREIGIFRAVGYRKSKVTKIILIEAALLSLVGGVCGYILGFALARMLPVFVKSIDVSVKLDIYLMAASVVLSLLIGMISSVLPAYRAANLSPALALKEL